MKIEKTKRIKEINGNFMKDSDWEILFELYKNPNMTKVANMLYMTQPSLTKRLQHMEEEFQVAIVSRTPKGLVFTEEGKFLAKQAGYYMEFLKETKEKLEELKCTIEEKIIIGSSYTYSKYSLAEVLVHYTEKYPKTNFEVINEQSNILFRKMLEGSIDVGFIRGDYEGPVNKSLIAQNQAYLVTKEPMNLEQLPKMHQIQYKTNDRTADLLNGWWRDQFKQSEIPGISVGYIDFAWEMIANGLGYTLCFLPQNFDNKYNLCLTPLEYTNGNSVIRNTWFVYSKSKRMTKTMEQFIKYIEDEVAI